MAENPSPGQYDKHLIPFGKEKKQSMTLGGKYKWKPDTNPPPGYYELADAITKSKSYTAVFNKTDAKKGGRLGKNDFTKLKITENPDSG